MSLMEYLPSNPAEQHGARKFQGATAKNYDKKREDSPKWQIEQQVIEDMLSDLPSGDWVLDCPAGTGRFFKFYHDKGLLFHGVDASHDMLVEALQKVVDPHKAKLHVGDIRDLSFLNAKSVDA